MTREKMLEARDLIQAQQYDQARAILVTIDHPKAREWLAKLDELVAPEKPKRDVAGPVLSATPLPSYAPPPAVQVNVTQQAAPSPVLVMRDQDSGPGCVAQFLWFVFLGSWLSQLAIIVGYLLVLTILLMPFGIMLLNKVPYLATLRSPKKQLNVTQTGNIIEVQHGNLPQRHWALRLVYFLFIGFWFGLVVIELAWILTATFFLAPLGLGLFRFSPTAISLRR